MRLTAVRSVDDHVFESVTRRKSRRVNPLAILIVVAIILGAARCYQWVEERDPRTMMLREISTGS